MSGRDQFKRWLEMGAIFGFLALAIVLLIVHQIALAARPKPVEDNLAVTAQASAMPDQGWAPLVVYFSAFGSSSLDAEIVSYEWDLNGDGYFETDATAQGGYAQFAYTSPGDYQVSLRVRDNQGRFGDEVLITRRRCERAFHFRIGHFKEHPGLYIPSGRCPA